jgi:hypothetical protein
MQQHVVARQFVVKAEFFIPIPACGAYGDKASAQRDPLQYRDLRRRFERAGHATRLEE